jgi:hypothetical protein
MSQHCMVDSLRSVALAAMLHQLMCNKQAVYKHPLPIFLASPVSNTHSYLPPPFTPPLSHQPVMVLGSGASTATLLWFGLSGAFPGAAAARVVAGLLNGIIVSWKCSIGESCEPLEQGRVRRTGKGGGGGVAGFFLWQCSQSLE